MSDPTPIKPLINIHQADNKVSIIISADISPNESEKFSVQAQKAIKTLFEKVGIKESFYIDDIFEILENYPAFLGRINGLLIDGKKEQLKAKIPDIDFELPEQALIQRIKKIWDENKEKRGLYITKIFSISEEDQDFKRDLAAKNKIEEYFPPEIPLHKLSPSEWEKQKDGILKNLQDESKTLFLFDNIFKHSPAPLNIKEGLDFITEVMGSPYKEKTICGLITHAFEKDKELEARRQICADKNIPIENFLLLSKKRTERALQFADGIKKALLNSSCEIIKSRAIEIIKTAQKETLKRLDELDAYAFDHIIINSSFKEGVWEPATLFRINDFLFGDNAKNGIINDPTFKEVVNKELENARAIGRISIGENTYNDHLSLRNQELYESKDLINKLNSPIENGDIFKIRDGNKNKLHILVTQPCDLMVRNDDGNRKSSFGTLLEIDEYTETALKSEIKSYNRKDPFRPHYFADKFKLQYFDNTNTEIKLGIIDFNKSILVDMAVLDLAVFNPEGDCKIDFDRLVDLNVQLQSSWRKRFESIITRFRNLMGNLESIKSSIDGITPDEVKRKIWLSLMPNVSFMDELGLKPSYNNKVFDFGIQRIMRYREPNATLLLNKYTTYLAREAEDHDFAN